MSATTTSPLTVSFGASGACTVLGDEVTLTGAVGSCTITASQAGDDNWNAAEDVDQSFAVGTGTTTTTLATSGSPSVYGDEVTFTATVSPSAATGTVIFYDGATVLDSVSLAGGTAALPWTLDWARDHTLTAEYLGDANYAASTSDPLVQVVTARPITVTADPQTKVYGGADPELTYRITSSSLVAGDSFTGGLERTPGEDVASYAMGREPSTSASATASRSWVPTS